MTNTPAQPAEPTEQPLTIEQDGPFRYTYADSHSPIARVRPGQSVRIRCVDCFGDRLTDESTHFADVATFPYTNPQTGPIYIEGAEPGDTLLVHLERIELTRDFAVSGLIPGFGLLTGTDRTRTLTGTLPETVKILPIREGRVWFSDRMSRPISPFVGTLGTAPKLEAINSLTPGSYGGNMDCPQTRAGNTVHFPVYVEGGLFFCGDGHALQGQGEIGGLACEIPIDVVCRFELIKGKAILWPRVTNERQMMVIGAARPLEDAARIACAELVEWVAAECSLSVPEALTWLSQVIELTAGNVCDPNYCMVAAVDKAHLGLDTSPGPVAQPLLDANADPKTDAG